MGAIIFFVEKNIHGAWTIYGVLGVKQYYYYSRKEAMQRYMEEARSKVLFNKGA